MEPPIVFLTYVYKYEKMWKPLMMANNTHIDNQWPIKNIRPAVAAAAAAAVPKQTYTHTYTRQTNLA